MQRVLVLDANQRSALAVIRSLGRRGLRPIAADHEAHPMGGASRYAIASVQCPDPSASPEAFVDEVAAIARRHEVGTIIPVTDLTTMLLVSQRDLPHFAKLACAHAPSYEALTDKASLFELAARLGVPVPETRIACNTADIRAAAGDLGYPLVLKPARSRFLNHGKIISTSVQAVHTAQQLAEALNRMEWLETIPCLVQRFIPGTGAGIFALYGESGPVAWFAHRRIREKPPSGGVSVLSESVRIDAEMQSAAAKLLSAVNWIGVAMVEFRVSGEGLPYLMEVNGRFWGSLQLAIDCGIDFPWLLYRAIHGLSTDVAGPYVRGQRLRWLLGDFDSLVIALRRNDWSRHRKVRLVGDFLRSFSDLHCRQETFRLSDPGPGFREVSSWLRALRR